MIGSTNGGTTKPRPENSKTSKSSPLSSSKRSRPHPLTFPSRSAPSLHHSRLSRATQCFVESPQGMGQSTDDSLPRRHRSHESLDQWFQRILHVKKLSPLDLCDLFSYGDTRKYPLVPLHHVCHVLFKLDPESKKGAGPLTDEMEEFLYQFSTEERGELMVNMRAALRALDIWHSRDTASACTPKFRSAPRSTLEPTNPKMKSGIPDLQDANVRLRGQSESARLASHVKASVDRTISHTWPPQHQANATKWSAGVSPTFTCPSALSHSRLQIVNCHEQELVEVASKLQFNGVKRLEQLLMEGDEDATGFVNPKQLWQLLADEFELEISATRLVEMCMGMTFDARATLDYKEFIDVLLDILIYAIPEIRESTKRTSLMRLDQYLQSGFPSGREHARQLLDQLCAKYDLNDDECISVAEFVRVLHVDLIQYHALKQPCPLQEPELVQLVYPFMLQHAAHDKSSVGFFFYPELLDALLGPFPLDRKRPMESAKLLHQAFEWRFWQNTYTALCGGDERMEKRVRGQLGKILAKLDPDSTFTISTRHFERIFARHFDSDDMAVLIAALTLDEDVNDASDEAWNGPHLRYDVLLSLVFGSPALDDKSFFTKHIGNSLLREHERLELCLKELLATKGPSSQLTIKDFYELCVVQAVDRPLTIVEMLFLFATVDSFHKGKVQVKTLNEFLARECWQNEECHEAATSTGSEIGARTGAESIRKLLAKCCAGHELDRALSRLFRKVQGSKSLRAVVKEVSNMFHELGLVDAHQDDLNSLVRSLLEQQSSTPCDALFDALLDWDALIKSMGMPDALVEVKQVFEKFDVEMVGTIPFKDWNKVYRRLCQGREMEEWQIRVVQRRFSGQRRRREREQRIDYIRLIVFLLDLHQRQVRKTRRLHLDDSLESNVERYGKMGPCLTKVKMKPNFGTPNDSDCFVQPQSRRRSDDAFRANASLQEQRETHTAILRKACQCRYDFIH